MEVKQNHRNIYCFHFSDDDLRLLQKVVTKMTTTEVTDISSLLHVVLKTVLNSCIARGC